MTHTATLSSTNVLEKNLAIAAVTGFRWWRTVLEEVWLLEPSYLLAVLAEVWQKLALISNGDAANRLYIILLWPSSHAPTLYIHMVRIPYCVCNRICWFLGCIKFVYTLCVILCIPLGVALRIHKSALGVQVHTSLKFIVMLTFITSS